MSFVLIVIHVDALFKIFTDYTQEKECCGVDIKFDTSENCKYLPVYRSTVEMVWVFYVYVLNFVLSIA